MRDSPTTGRHGSLVRLTWLNLDQPPVRCAQMSLSLSAQELARANRFVMPRDRYRYISGRYAMRIQLASELGLPAKLLHIDTGVNGKPFLPEHEQLSFNLSHSKALGLLVIAPPDLGEVGVDVEWSRALSTENQDDQTLLARCLTARELKVIEPLRAEQRSDAFFQIWTRKEAALKALGLGFQVEPNCFDSGWQKGELPAECSSVPVRVLDYPTVQVFDLDLKAQKFSACHAALAFCSQRRLLESELALENTHFDFAQVSPATHEAHSVDV